MTHSNSQFKIHKKKTYSNHYRIGYFIKYNYLPVDSKDEDFIVFFNPRKNQCLKFPNTQQRFTKADIKSLFDSEAIDLSKKAEWLRFRFFKYSK